MSLCGNVVQIRICTAGARQITEGWPIIGD